MPTPDELAARKDRLIAQCELDRMRVEHAVLGVREAASPFLGFRAMSHSMAGRAIAIALPLFAAVRQHGLLRVGSLVFGLVRTLRRFFRRRR
jgi:hypothetical protein